MATSIRNRDKLKMQGLTKREQQVVSVLLQGHSNKEIAYELGLAAATVRVLMVRAARKLGASGREDAIVCFRRLDRV